MTLASSPSLPYPHWPANGTVGEKVCRTLDSQPVAAHHWHRHALLAAPSRPAAWVSIAHRPLGAVKCTHNPVKFTIWKWHAHDAESQAYLTREMAYRPIQSRAYRADNISPPFYKFLAYAGVSVRTTYGPIWWSRPTWLIKPCPNVSFFSNWLPLSHVCQYMFINRKLWCPTDMLS